MGSGIEDSSRICPLPPGSEKGLNWHLKPRSIFMAVGLSFILTSTALLSYMMQSPIITGPPDITGGDSSGSRGRVALGIPHGPIAIDGDANLADSALLEGWPGDGSPENPYIIDGLAIDLDGNSGSCVSISNTHVSFIIRNCSFTGASGEELWHGFGAGIFLRDVTNGELAKNILYGNRFGIGLWLSESNTVANNTCDDNTEHGIFLLESDSNTVANNTCSSNRIGIDVGYMSAFNTVSDNTCHSNVIGIQLAFSNSSTVANNTCSNNTEHGIYLLESDSNTVTDNTCSSNRVGIEVGYLSVFNTVSDNTCDSNEDHGIHLAFSNSSTVAGNTCRKNDYGILLVESDSNTVTDNTCSSNRVGIEVGYMSAFNTVSDNTCHSNVIGIQLAFSNSSILASNICYSNRVGIQLVNSGLNTMINNIFYDPETITVILLLFGLAGIILLGAGWRMTYEASRWPERRQQEA